MSSPATNSCVNRENGVADPFRTGTKRPDQGLSSSCPSGAADRATGVGVN